MPPNAPRGYGPVLQCSYPPYRLRHQRCLANSDWMPMSYISGQPSNPCRHPTCWASSQWSHTVSSTLCHGAWTPFHSALHRVKIHGVSNWYTHLYPPHNNSLVHLKTTTYVRRTGRITNGMRSGRTTPQACAFSSQTPAPTTPAVTLPRRELVRLNRLRTGVGRFRSSLYKWCVVFSAACECGAEEQTVNHVVLKCPIQWPPHELHGLTVLDDETIEWLLNTCPEISCGQTVVRRTGSKDKKEKA